MVNKASDKRNASQENSRKLRHERYEVRDEVPQLLVKIESLVFSLKWTSIRSLRTWIPIANTRLEMFKGADWL